MLLHSRATVVNRVSVVFFVFSTCLSVVVIVVVVVVVVVVGGGGGGGGAAAAAAVAEHLYRKKMDVYTDIYDGRPW